MNLVEMNVYSFRYESTIQYQQTESTLTSSLRWHHLLSPGSSITDLRAGLSCCHGNHFSQAVDIRATQGPDDLVSICHWFKLSGTAGQRSLVFCTWPIGGADCVHPHSRYQTYIWIILCLCHHIGLLLSLASLLMMFPFGHPRTGRPT